MPLPYQATFDSEQFARLKEGLIPEQMEDKWFIYYEEPHLFLHRSWTGEAVYRITLKAAPNGAAVTEALWSRGLADVSREALDYAAQLLDFLVSDLLLGQVKPFPLRSGLAEPMPGVFQHHVSGTAYPESPPRPKKLSWRVW